MKLEIENKNEIKKTNSIKEFMKQYLKEHKWLMNKLKEN